VYNRRAFEPNGGGFSVNVTSGAGRGRIDLRCAPIFSALCLAVLGGLSSPPSIAQPGSADAGQAKSAICASCHGADGNSVTPEWPSLAGQHATYIIRQLEAYRSGERQDVGMQNFAATLSEQDMSDIAAYFSSQALRPKGADPALVGLGEEIYRGGLPERSIPACIACHGPTGSGNPLAAYPRVGGQHAIYTLGTLRSYGSGARRSDGEAQTMRNVAELLLEDEMRAVASYIQGLR
jgi:cytochrome c553